MTRSLPRWLGLGLAVTVGCFDSASIDLPPVDAGGALLFVHGLGTPGAQAIFVSDPSEALALPRTDVTALYYPWPAETIWPAGAVLLSAARGQPLPAPTRFMRADAVDGVWVTSEPTDELLAGFRLPTPDARECLASGGCIPLQGPLRCGSCERPSVVPSPSRVHIECPEGWTLVTSPGRVGGCRPVVAPRLDCGPGQWQGSNAMECGPLMACPAGDWPVVPPGPQPVLYLRPEATPGGDGSLDRPFRTLREALDAAAPQTRVLIGEGVLREAPRIEVEGLTLIGLCPERSRIEVGDAALTIGAPDVTLRGLTLHGSGDAAVYIGAAASASLEAADIVDLTGNAVTVDGGTLVGRGLRTRAQLALDLRAGTASVSHFDHRGGGLARCEAASLRLSDGAGTWTQAAPEALIDAMGCPEVFVSHTRLEGAGATGLNLTGAVEMVTVTDSVFRDLDKGLTADELVGRPSLVLERAFFEDIQSRAVEVMPLVVVASHVTVLDAGHIGLELKQGSTTPSLLRFDHLWVRGRSEHLVRIGKAKPGVGNIVVEGSDWVLETLDDRLDPDAALSIQDGVEVRLDRVHIDGTPDVAAQIKCSRVRFTNLTIEGGAQDALLVQAGAELYIETAQINARGAHALRTDIVGVCDGAHATLRDVVFNGCADCGVALAVDGAAVVDASQVEVRDFETGIRVDEASSVGLTDSLLEGNAVGIELPADHDIFDVLRGVWMDNEQDVLQR